MEEARRLSKGDAAEIAGYGKQASLAEQGRELVERDEEREQVGEPEPALDDETTELVV